MSRRAPIQCSAKSSAQRASVGARLRSVGARLLTAIVGALSISHVPGDAFAGKPSSAKHLVAQKRGSSPKPASTSNEGWSAGTLAEREVSAGHPFVARVFVPLCSNDQIDCGNGPAGRAGDLTTNLYWGAAFGARHFFDRKKSGWERLSVAHDVNGELERVAYRRFADGAAWGKKGKVEQIVVVSAIHGDLIDQAVQSFWETAAHGGRVAFDDGDTSRTERISVVGYAGHDRLMDGLELPSKPESASADAIPSFVFACYSEKYFGPSLRRIGSDPLLSTKALMAPEAYVIDAALVALGDNQPRAKVRERTVAAYAKWQRLDVPVASSMFE